MSLKDDWREHVLDQHALGMNRREITEQVPMSSAYVSQIVAEAGRTFTGGGQTARATQGRIAKCTKVRAAQAERLISLAEQAFAAGAVAGALVLYQAIDDLVGFGPAEALRGTEKDPQWIAKAMGLPQG